MARTEISSLAQLELAFLHQVRFYLRTYRFVGLMVLVSAISAIILVFNLVFGVGSDTASTYLASSIGGIGTAIVLSSAFLGGDAIAMDFGSPTGYYMLVLPVRRIVLLTGRFLGAVATAFVIGLTYFAFSVGGAWYFFGAGALPWGTIGESLVLATVYLLAAMGLAFLFSSFFRTPAVAMIATVLIVLLGFSIVTGVVEVGGYEPWFSLTYASNVIGQVFSSNFQHTMRVGESSFVGYQPYLWEGVAIMVSYLVICFGLSAVIYQYKESKG